MIDAKKSDQSEITLNYGMVGGSEGSFIGDVHRKAAAFDGKCNLVAGCFSRTFNKTLTTGERLNINKERLYENYQQMAQMESEREDGIDFVSIVAQNYIHYDVAKVFLQAGIHVVCEKPLCFEIEQAKELKQIAEEKNLLFMVTYSYSGYPMVEEARHIVRSGQVGEIRTIMGEYPQDWLTNLEEETDNQQAKWRTDPKIAGISNCLGDIGSHIENTVHYITGLNIKRVCAKLECIPPERPLDTNAQVLVEFENGASGMYWSSQIAVGHENGLRVRIYGTKGSIEWNQETPNHLKVCTLGQPVQIYSRSQGYISNKAQQLTRLPAGHPEAYYEAFANIYVKFAHILSKKLNNEDLSQEDLCFTDVTDGLNGVTFIHKCVESSKKGSVWVDVD